MDLMAFGKKEKAFGSAIKGKEAAKIAPFPLFLKETFAETTTTSLLKEVGLPT